MFRLQVTAQCVENTLAYDTTVTGTGTQSEPYQFTFPKFDAATGTLISVKVISIVTLSYSYTIENLDVNAGKSYGVKINRDDLITSSVAPAEGLEYTYTGPKQTIPLAAADATPGSGPDFRNVPPKYILNKDTAINAVLYNTSDFMGLGDVSFEYSSDVGATISGGLTIDMNGDAQDEIKFMIVYTFCNENIPLASNITAFTAAKKNDLVDIRWLTNNEQAGRQYELLKSIDGRAFTSVEKFNAAPDMMQAGNYKYNYIPQPGEKGKITFRIKQTDADGNVEYSTIRIVDLGNAEKKPGIRIFPNPSPSGRDITIVLDDHTPGDWQVELYNVKGQLLQRQQEYHTLVSKISATKTKLPSGLYIVRAFNKKTNEEFVERLIIQ